MTPTPIPACGGNYRAGRSAERRAAWYFAWGRGFNQGDLRNGPTSRWRRSVAVQTKCLEGVNRGAWRQKDFYPTRGQLSIRPPCDYSAAPPPCKKSGAGPIFHAGSAYPRVRFVAAERRATSIYAGAGRLCFFFSIAAETRLQDANLQLLQG